jgi:serine phosphatase RsbU (regulator of sigma subunit)
VLLFVQGDLRRRMALELTPFRIGRKAENDLVIADPRVSREHAHIVRESDGFYLVDQGSKHGTYVNGDRVQRHKLQPNDRMEFGVREGPCLLFCPERYDSSTVARELLTSITELKPSGAAADLQKLRVFFEAARKLNASGVLEDILLTLIEATLRITGGERGFVFLRDKGGQLRLAVGCNAGGEPLSDDRTISRSILYEAANTASEFLVGDTSRYEDLAARDSIVAYDLRSVVCVPLRKTRVQRGGPTPLPVVPPEVMGVLYMDSRIAAGELSSLSNDLLHAIATEAAALVENAHLAQMEEAARRYEQELGIAASIQQRLMSVNLPQVPFAEVQARNLSCRDIGGDFYDVVHSEQGLTAVIADVCGKGISAALLASILQGMIYSDLTARMPLRDIVATADRFLRQKELGEKYATLVLAQLKPDGEMEFVNCGHVRPLLISDGRVSPLEPACVPIGIITGAEFESACVRLQPGDRLVLYTDGVTDALDREGKFFEEERLHKAVAKASSVDEIFRSIREFCGDQPLEDDCTVLQLFYKGK